MSVTIVRNPGQGDALFFPSGSISFSQLRSYFKETGSGTVSASELRRNTNLSEANPTVPDATHNEQISTGSNLSLSQFRNSVKRYRAIQSGTDDNSHGRQEPGFRMGLYDPYGNGLDFAGGGVNGRDGQGGNNTGNHTKNIQKEVYITGTCGSVQPGEAGAQIAPVVTVHNFRIEVFGSILGCGGRGGGTSGAPSISGENGGVALNLGSIGYNNRVIVKSGCRIWAGGGGGERGRNGDNGTSARCVRSETFRSGCQQGAISCPGGWNQTGSWNTCCSWRRGCAANYWYRVCEQSYNTDTPIGGIGGNGGPGRGYNNQSGSLSGSNGTTGSCPTCNGGFAQQGGSCSQNGEKGGDGGEWANDGQGTSNSGDSGKAGKAINATGARPLVDGETNSNTIKGSIY